MATQSVTQETLPPRHFERHCIGIDKQGPRAIADAALHGAAAISSVIQANRYDDTKGIWSDNFIDDLHDGHDALLLLARHQLKLLGHELWYTHALLGDYGEEAKAKALAEMATSEGFAI